MLLIIIIIINMSYKMIAVSEKTHAELTRLLQKEIVKNKGRKVTFNELLIKLMSKDK